MQIGFCVLAAYVAAANEYLEVPSQARQHGVVPDLRLSGASLAMIPTMKYEVDVRNPSLVEHSIFMTLEPKMGFERMSVHVPRPCSVDVSDVKVVTNAHVELETSIMGLRLRDMRAKTVENFVNRRQQAVPDICIDAHILALKRKTESTILSMPVTLKYVSGQYVAPWPSTIPMKADQTVRIHFLPVVSASIKVTALHTSIIMSPKYRFSSDTVNTYNLKSENTGDGVRYSMPTELVAPMPPFSTRDILNAMILERFVLSQMDLVWTMNSPILYLKNLDRSMYIGFWDNKVKITEDYLLSNKAASFEGEYEASRIHEWSNRQVATVRSKKPQAPSPIMLYLDVKLPQDTTNVEFFDRIGNISSTSIVKKRKGFEVQLEPRHPLLGGWDTEWTLQYSVKLDVLKMDNTGGSSRTAMYVPLAGTIRDVFVKDSITHVILPPGSSEIRVQLPAPYNKIADVQYSTVKKWFDLFTSRPVVSVRVPRVGFKSATGENAAKGFTYGHDSPAIKISYNTSGYWRASALHALCVPILVVIVVVVGLYCAVSVSTRAKAKEKEL